jgi:hypothetical protein
MDYDLESNRQRNNRLKSRSRLNKHKLIISTWFLLFVIITLFILYIYSILYR